MENVKSLTRIPKHHATSKPPNYGRWRNMITRCHNPKCHSYKDYGARGISVCKAWRQSFSTFAEYISKLPHFEEKGYTLDRIDNDGNYEPGNVRWATWLEQANNRRKFAHVRLFGFGKGQLAILQLMACGLSYQEIAQLRQTSPQTVRDQAASILKKIGAKNRVQAALYALRNNLISLEQAWLVSLKFRKAQP